MKSQWIRLLCGCILLCLLLCGCQEANQIIREHVFDETLPTEEPTQPPTETVPMNTAPIEFLMLLYPNDNTVTGVDYELLEYFQMDDGNYYKVVWTVDVEPELVKIVSNDDGTVTVDVNELCQEDTPYTLTASIATAEGYRLTHSWEHTLPKCPDMVQIVENAYALKHGQRLEGMYTLTGKVTSIEKQWDQDYQNVTLTIQVEGCESKPIRCYCLVGEGVEDICVGDVITVTGMLQRFSSRVEFDLGCTLNHPQPLEETEPETE